MPPHARTEQGRWEERCLQGCESGSRDLSKGDPIEAYSVLVGISVLADMYGEIQRSSKHEALGCLAVVGILARACLVLSPFSFL